MFERFLKRARNLSRHLEGPFLAERQRYMIHVCREGRADRVLAKVNGLLLAIAQRIDIAESLPITTEQISTAAEQWIHERAESYKTPQHMQSAKAQFVSVASRWLSFLGRLDTSPKILPFSQVMAPFLSYMRDECGFSRATIGTRRECLEPFFRWLAQSTQIVSTVSSRDISVYLSSSKLQLLRRTTISLHVQSLRAFFRYAALRGWCAREIAECIDAPCLYKHEHLPQGPRWEDVKRLLDSVRGNTPEVIRDRPILLLHAIYGFRVSEVRRLRLDDIDWENEVIRVRRSKQRKTQEYPLTQEVGEAILRYLKYVRPQCPHREVFLSLRQPFRPLSRVGLGTVTRVRQKRLGLRLRKYGPHGLRHACATHLLSGGFSLKEVGDHLGHSSLESTQVYAKVNLPALREVAKLGLKDVIRFAEQSERRSTPVYRRGDMAAMREVARLSLEDLA
jgi:integrase/recombinase XerD